MTIFPPCCVSTLQSKLSAQKYVNTVPVCYPWATVARCLIVLLEQEYFVPLQKDLEKHFTESETGRSCNSLELTMHRFLISYLTKEAAFSTAVFLLTE